MLIPVTNTLRMHELAEVIETLKRRGYAQCFAYRAGRVWCAAQPEGLDIDQIELVDTIELDAGTDPGDDVTIFLLQTSAGTRGFVLVSDSFHADPQKADLIDRLLKARAEKRTVD